MKKDAALYGTGSKGEIIRDDADDKVADGMAYRRNQRKSKRGGRKGGRK